MENIKSIIDKVRAIALEGLSYAKNHYDIERYNKLLEIVSKKYSELSDIHEVILLNQFKKETGCITPKIGIAVAVINNREEVLVLRRTDDDRWSLPCGWMDVGENILETAIREVQEEAGIAVKPIKCLAISSKGPDEYEDIIYHQVNILIGTKVLTNSTLIRLNPEHSDYRWITDIDDIAWHSGHERLSDAAFKFAKGRLRSGIKLTL